jgi:hypothetical protein
MTDEEAKKIQAIARSIAVKWHRPELAEDFAQEAVIARLRWPGLELEYAFINLLRKEYGSSRTPGGRARQIGTARAIELDAARDDTDAHPTLNHDLVGDPRSDPRIVGSPRNYAHLFRGREAQVYALVFEEELPLKKTGEILGLSEPRMWQIARKIRNKITLEDGLEEVKETLEEDPGITRIEIDWIRV